LRGVSCKIVGMASTLDRYAEIAALIARHAPADGQASTAIGNLFFGRCSSPSQPHHAAQWPCFALLAQGEKILTLGNDALVHSTHALRVAWADPSRVGLPVSRSARASRRRR
jgi:hypothetical protein